MTWKVMPSNVWNDIVSWRTKRLNNSIKNQLLALWENCHKYALKLFWNACSWHVLEDLIFCEQTCTIDHKMDQSLWQTIISFDIIHSSYMWLQRVLPCWEALLNNSDWDCFKTDFAGDLEDSKSTSGGTLCIFGSHACKKQTSFSHSSTESEIISLHAGLRLDGMPALDFRDLIVAVLGNTNQSNKARGDLCPNQREVRSSPQTIHKRKQSQRVINDLDNVDFPPSKLQSSRQEALLYVCLKTTTQWSRWL